MYASQVCFVVVVSIVVFDMENPPDYLSTHPPIDCSSTPVLISIVFAHSRYVKLLEAGLKGLASVSDDADNAGDGGAGFGTSWDNSVTPPKLHYVFSLLIHGYNSNMSHQVLC